MLNNPGYDIHYDQQTQWASLNVKEAFPKVSGRYTCKAKNIAGEATTTAVNTFELYFVDDFLL